MKIGTDQHKLRFWEEIIPTPKVCYRPSLTVLALAGVRHGVWLHRS